MTATLPAAATMADSAAAGRVVPAQQTFLGMPPFPEAARAALANSQQRKNLSRATHTIRARRQERVDEVDDWTELRAAAKAVKDHALRFLPVLLERFEEAATAAGAQVHWARDAAEANEVVASIVLRLRVASLVKAKSMATEEIGLTRPSPRSGSTLTRPTWPSSSSSCRGTPPRTW